MIVSGWHYLTTLSCSVACRYSACVMMLCFMHIKLVDSHTIIIMEKIEFDNHIFPLRKNIDEHLCGHEPGTG
jgi:hypothetical protein